MRVICEAEIGSDHHLVLMKVKISGRHKMKRRESSCQLRRKRPRRKEGKVRFRARHGESLRYVSWRRLKLCV